jgi:acetyltransferase-like isoleucine patch superfamily enzyme
MTSQTQSPATSLPRARTVRHCTPPSPAARVVPALVRRWRLFVTRLRWPRAHFGSRCDVRSGLHLQMGQAAQVEFEPECVLDRDMTIECDGDLRVGARTIFGHHCTLACMESVVIGPDCLIAEMVSIRDHDHCFDDLMIPTRDQGASVQSVEIGRNVWLGAKVTVAKGVRIGENAVVGANAVVTKDVPANAVVGGIPARVIRMRGEAAAH